MKARTSPTNSLHAELTSSAELLDEIVPTRESSSLLMGNNGKDKRGHYLAVPTGIPNKHNEIIYFVFLCNYYHLPLSSLASVYT